MIILGKIYVIFKKLVCLISSIMLLIVGNSEKDLPLPDGAEIVDKTTYVLTDYHMSSQGITNDGEYFYLSGNDHISKARMDDGEIFKVNLYAIPKDLQDLGCDHIGGLSYYDGIIYAAVEDGPEYLHPYIVLYDAETLEFTGTYYELPQNLHIEGVPWCAVDSEKGYLYTAEWSNTTLLNVFNLEDMSLVKTIPLSSSVDRIQGCEMFDGKLYMSADVGAEKEIFCLDVETGLITSAFTRNIGEEFEAEGMTVYADENGEPVFCVLDRGAERYSTNITSYKLTK